MIQLTSTSLDSSSSLTESIVALAESRLLHSGYRVLQQVHCEYESGVLTLRGQVPSFYMKQMAQTLVKPLGGLAAIDNRIVVTSGQ